MRNDRPAKPALSPLPQPEFLPASRREMEALGWDELDILLIQGDAYIDHPAQGPALLGRWLAAHGFRVGLVSQPAWRDQDRRDFAAMGRPRLFAALSAGSMDSMLAHYTAFRKKRSDDALTPGGRAGARPNRATLVYTGLVRAEFPGLPVAVGGLEASLRRLSHYDFWQDKLRPSILLESKADILVYGPGERPLLELARRLAADGVSKEALVGIDGTVTALGPGDRIGGDCLKLPSHEDILANPKLLLETALAQESLVHRGGRRAVQASGGRGVLMRPPAAPLTTEEMDFIHALPFTRRAHPSYTEAIPALEVLARSITTHRGCGGGCSFCSLAAHQGRRVISRSFESIVTEAARLAGGKPTALSDVGGPTANMWRARCQSETECRRVSCLWPKPCRNLAADQAAWLGLLEAIAELPGLKRVRVASGLRYDLAMTDEKVLKKFLQRFVGGQLKVAPEHLEESVLKLMRKPPPELFQKFLALFERQRAGKQYLTPYLISAFPGSTLEDMKRTAQWFRQRNWRPRQVQAFIPTPGTVATAMFYAATDGEQSLFVARTDRARQAQHSLLTDGLPVSPKKRGQRRFKR